MMDQELIDFLNRTVDEANHLIDKLIPMRQAGHKEYRYMIKKLEVIIGAVHRAQDKIPVSFSLDENSC